MGEDDISHAQSGDLQPTRLELNEKSFSGRINKGDPRLVPACHKSPIAPRGESGIVTGNVCVKI